jgi:S-adenosylmethionine hydrolase
MRFPFSSLLTFHGTMPAMLLHIIADFGHADLAFAEVSQRLKLFLPEAELVLTTVPPFATLAAGFCVAQLGLNEAPEDMLVFHNVAPRRDDQGARQNNDGERLAYALLPNGVKVVGVHAGYAFSFVRDVATDLRYVNVASAGSQFRSRDLFPRAVAAVAREGSNVFAEVMSKEHVPDIPEKRVAYVDGFGNIKTSIAAGEYKAGQQLQVRLNAMTHTALVSDGSFSIPQGTLTFSPGSSGWQTPSGSVRWTELFLRGGSAARLFDYPANAESISVEPVLN